MIAIEQKRWGGTEELRLVERPRPEPLPTEVLVRVKAAGVNPVDVYTREGKAYMRALSLPFIPGWDISGVVEAVGYGVTRFKAGDEVFGMPWFPRSAAAYAQYATAPSRQLALKPAGVSHQEAAALPLAGTTAWNMVSELAKVEPGMRVLISGGAGGVGHLAIQIAKSMGAWVAATASAEKHPFLRALGADVAIDYLNQSPLRVVKDLDVVIELIGGATCIEMLKLVRKGGKLITAQAAWAPTLPQEALQAGVDALWYLVEPDYVALEHLSRLIEAGKLKVHVSHEFPLASVREAHAMIATRRVTGKVVLIP